MGQPLGCGRVRRGFFHDHRFTRHSRVDRRDFPDHRGHKGHTGRSGSREAGLFDRQEGKIRDRRNHRPVLALRRSGVGIHLRSLLSLVSEKMAAHVEGQQHPIGIYLKIWGLLFVLSTASYLVDYFHFQGYLRWFLILTFMLMKAGLIVAVFMHMLLERLAMMYAILVPTLLLMVLLGIGALEADYTFFTRGVFFLKGLF